VRKWIPQIYSFGTKLSYLYEKNVHHLFHSSLISKYGGREDPVKVGTYCAHSLDFHNHLGWVLPLFLQLGKIDEGK
jgi:hypothetical protein